ncbi:MAG TPA: MFS transporter [Candidatus Paceibacterota bacterium]|jgi:predicted MFS family arabinose efflux permease|nr:MFS transporter [Candidatus Paceibacterota bacterium]
MNNSIPKEIRLISLATSIRWIGWGMAEPLIPVFLFILLGEYGLSGLIGSAGEVVFLLILPLAGILADRIPLKTFLVAGVVIFFFDGLWSIAALGSLVLLVFIAEIFDGIAVASDVVDRATYIRRYARREVVASVIGWQTTLINVGWMVGACLSWILAPYVSFVWIFFGIVPANLVALYMLARYLPADAPPPARSSNSISFAHYFDVWRDTLRLHNGLRALAMLTIIFNALSAFAVFLIPIYAYIQGATLREIILLGILAMLPDLFSSPLGKIADRFSASLLPLGLLAAAMTLAALSFVSWYPFLLLIVLGLRVILVLLGLAVENLITKLTSPYHYGRTSAVFEGLKDVGKFIGAIGLGFALDQWGGQAVFIALAAFMVVATLLATREFRKHKARTATEPAQ